MKLVIVSFTRGGALLASRIGAVFPEASLYTIDRLAEELHQLPLGGLKAWTAQWFHRVDGMIFVSAAGIAVRAIAPHIRDKFTDPAVVSVDEGGQFVIPLLSGHVGGANELARAVAEKVGGVAAISTATDVRGLFAVDVWAKEQGLLLQDRAGAKRVSAALLEGETVGISSDFPISGPCPKGLAQKPGPTVGIWVTVQDGAPPFLHTLKLCPKGLVVGVGCRKNLPPNQVEQVVTAVLQEHHLAQEAVCALASIDLKAHDLGILALAERWSIPRMFYSSEDLNAVPGTFTGSAFVAQVTGTDNVCERAALLGSMGGTLVVRKQSRAGVTVAVACKPIHLRF